MAQSFSRIIAIAMLGTMVAAGAGTMCLLPAMAQSSSSSSSSSVSAASTPSSVPVSGCHAPRVPSHPQSADYRCCVGRHSSALLTKIFPSRPALQILEFRAADVPVAASDADFSANTSIPSDGSPGILILRI